MRDWIALIAIAATCGLSATGVRAADRIPVILDTDIGDDIDDTWALAFLLKSPEVDLKLVVGDNRKALYRAKLIARFLERAGRTDVPVGVGLGAEDTRTGGQAKWVADYDLGSYPGKVQRDGVQAIIDLILSSPQQVTLVAIGPVPNLAEALKREPRIVQRCRFVGMHGSVRLGYDGNPKPCPEYNVREDIRACQVVFTAGWDMTITPLDTCGLVRLRGPKFQALRESNDPVVVSLLENYDIWAGEKRSESSVLFDTVAAYLSFAEELLTLEELKIRVDDRGMTVIDPAGKSMRVATKWRDLGAFEDLLVRRLTQGPASR